MSVNTFDLALVDSSLAEGNGSAVCAEAKRKNITPAESWYPGFAVCFAEPESGRVCIDGMDLKSFFRQKGTEHPDQGRIILHQ